MVISEKIYLKAYIHNQYICLKNNIVQLYFRETKLHLNFSSIPEDGSDIFTDFPTRSGSQPCALLDICEYHRYPSKMEKFKCSLALPNIKYIIIQYYFWHKCIGYLCMLSNILVIEYHCSTYSVSFLISSKKTEYIELPIGCWMAFNDKKRHNWYTIH